MSIIEKAVRKFEKEIIDKTQTKTVKSDSKDDAVFKRLEKNEKNSASVSQAGQSLQSPSVITIDLDLLHENGIVTPNQGRTQIAEQFRIIKRPLLTNIFNKRKEGDKNTNLIMLSSALSGEGKSFCAVNLAMSIATEMDNRVLLIDADVAYPSIPSILGLKTEKGLLDLLLDDNLGVCDVLLKTSVEKLSIITAGTPHSHATELLASRNMELLLEELAQRYDDRIIIFDSPPLLLTSEARVIASHMGQIVLVVESEKTAQQDVEQALRQVKSCKNVSLIYNKDRSILGNEYDGYYHS